MGTSANQLPSIVERFERVCDTYPQRPALVTETQSLDYRSLNSAANAVAHQIAAQIDAGPRRIAVLLSEELSALITILGILKAGHTYVPLDRDYPHERTRYMLDNCGAALLLVDANTREQANALDCPCAQLTIEQNRNPRGANPGKTINPNSPAYVLYTSGSTGAPKGIVQTHRNLAHHVDNFSRPLSIGPQDRLAVFASLCFAASLMDVYGALLSGAALYPHYLKHHDLTTLAEWLSQHEVSVFHSTLTVFRQLCQTLSAEHQLRTVRVIDLAGEPLYWSDVTLYKRHFDSSCNLVNRLALTEVQTVAQYRVTHETEAEGTLVPVGEPAPGIELFIQDDAGAPAATGEVGTIGVRSRYLAPGNCDNPGLESVDPQEPRMLLTGDIGYLDTNRHLFHLGRTDARVKIRGFSIDLAEVEAALQSFDAIAKAAVVVGDSGNGYERLVAYLEPRKPATLTPHAVFEYLRRKLPQYMLPAYLLIEPELPLTPNGKIDKNVLATSIERRPAMSNPLVAPRNHTEEQLLVLWERTLGLTGIGVSDEFWSLGGDSLVAADLLTEIERALEQRLPLSSITLFTTIEQLAGEIAAGVSHQTGPVLTTLREGTGAGSLFCIHGGGGDIYRFVELATHLDGREAIYALQPRAPRDLKTLHDTVEQIAASYCAEIVKHQPVGPYVLTGYSFGGLVAYEMARQFEQAHKTVGLLVMFDPILRMDEGGWAKLQRHAQAIKKRPLADKLDYALSRLGIFRDKVATDIIKRLSVLSVVWRTRRGHSLSDERRKAQFTLAQQATRRYRLNHYSGDVVLFTSARRAEPRWRSVIGGELAVHTIDCEHVALLSPPALHEIAKKLNEALRP